MPMPRVPNEAFTEREGVNFVATVANRAHCVWRETPTRDVGIDGHIEYIATDGSATGRTVAVQIKAGESYFGREHDAPVRYSPTARHLAYWQRSPFSVV